MTAISETGPLGWLARRRARKAVSGRAYQGLMKTALNPHFFASGALPDTFDGRAHAVTAHLAPLARRLNAIGTKQAVDLSTAINTRVLDGFDAAFREKSVGDSSIARKMRKLAEVHYGLGSAIAGALGSADPRADLLGVLERNGAVMAGHGGAYVDHILDLSAQFEAQSDADIMAGRINWTALQT